MLYPSIQKYELQRRSRDYCKGAEKKRFSISADFPDWQKKNTIPAPNTTALKDINLIWMNTMAYLKVLSQSFEGWDEAVSCELAEKINARQRVGSDVDLSNDGAATEFMHNA